MSGLNQKANSRTRPALSRIHTVSRLAGMTGFFLALMALVLGNPGDPLASAGELWQQLRFSGTTLWGKMVLGGVALAVLALGVEIVVAMQLAAGRRSALGMGATLQAALALAAAVTLNYWSFSNYWLLDITRDRLFTLPPELKAKLGTLQEETTIVVCQLHKTFGHVGDKPDRYDYAAERVVVGKVKDLVDQLRELGPKFKVIVLDVEEESYEGRLASLSRQAPALAKAIETAPENSIFFWARKQGATGQEMIQRLGFNEFYRLDKAASQSANEGKGNLVLLPQGGEGSRAVELFARRILALEARKPRVAVAVVDEWLTTKGTESFGLAGLRAALESQGYEVRDILLRKLRQRPVTAVAYTFDESKLDRLEQRLRGLDLNLERFDKGMASLGKMVEQWKLTPLADLEKTYADLLRGAKLSEDQRKLQVEYFEAERKNIQEARDRFKKQKDEVLVERNSLDVDSLVEQQRLADLEAKTSFLLADCDLLVVPRPSLHDVITDDRNLPSWLHGLDPAQLKAVKGFVKSGKPLLALVGPANEAPDQGPVPPGFTANDGFEELLGQLGFRFGRQTVLFDEEVEGFGEQMAGLLTGGTNVKIPPLALEWKEGAGLPPALKPSWPLKAHPVREALRLSARGQSVKGAMDLSLRHPRPVYFEPKGLKLAHDPTLFLTSADSWNEAQPFPESQGLGGDRKMPAYNPDDKDPNKGTLDARRRGPFPVGAAAEVPIPPEWLGADEVKGRTVRAAVIGESWFLVGPTLDTAKQRLVLDICNWLTGRDDLLPAVSPAWQFPRVNLPRRSQDLWLWGARLGLPAFFAYLGFVALVLRRMR